MPVHSLLREVTDMEGQGTADLQLRLSEGRGTAITRVPGVGLYYNELLEGGHMALFMTVQKAIVWFASCHCAVSSPLFMAPKCHSALQGLAVVSV